MRILLVRHGQTPFNLDGTIDTTIPGAPLTALGIAQAQALSDSLDGASIDGLFVSSLRRTALTIAPLARRTGLVPVELDGLREIEGGELEKRGDPVAQETYLDVAFGWSHGEWEWRVPGAESGQEFFARYDSAVEAVLRAGHDVAVVVSHGSAIRTWVGARCRGAGHGFAGTHQLDNTGMAILEGDRISALRLVEWRTEPAGGQRLSDPSAADPTGMDVEQ